jgi:hypothetical protein
VAAPWDAVTVRRRFSAPGLQLASTSPAQAIGERIIIRRLGEGRPGAVHPEEEAQHVDRVGDVDRAIIVRVGRSQTGWCPFLRGEEVTQRMNCIREIHDAVGVRVAIDHPRHPQPSTHPFLPIRVTITG